MALRLPKNPISIDWSEKRNTFHSFRSTNDPIKAYFFNNSTPESQSKQKSRSSQNCALFKIKKSSQDLTQYSTPCIDHTWIKVCSQCNLRDQEKTEVSQQLQIIPKLNLDESCDLFLNFKEKNAISPKIFKKISCKHCKRLESNSPRSVNAKVKNENENRIKPDLNKINVLKNLCINDQVDDFTFRLDKNIKNSDKVESDDDSINLILELDDSINESIMNSNKNLENMDDLIYNIIVNQSIDLTSKILTKIFKLRLAQSEKRDFYFHKYVIVWLKCPLTKRRVDIPARGLTCEHVECFDLKEYLCLNYSNKIKKWQCPICSQSIKPNQIVVDSFIAFILASCTEEIIQFNESLEWSNCFSDIQYIDTDYKVKSFY